MDYKKEISVTGQEANKVLEDFLNTIQASNLKDDTFLFKNKKWLVVKHPWEHGDDIIVHESIVNDYDYFLLVKHGNDRVRIPGFCSKQQLLSTPKTDIYRNGKLYHSVMDVNIKDLEKFKIPNDTNKKLLEVFSINEQQAKNLGHTEMISSVLAGFHYFAKKSKTYFKDLNQKDECMLGDHKVKIYVRQAASDEDILISDEYFQKNQDTTLYVCCKVKKGFYTYLGYVTKQVVAETRIVEMIGASGTSRTSDKLRRIFAEQYKPLSDIMKIYVSVEEEKENIIPQNYVPLHSHCEFSVGDGFGKIDYIAEALRKRGFKGAALTDHGTLAGALYWQKALLERNLKPLIGYEAYIKTDLEDERRYHLTLIAKNKTGYENILKLHAKAVIENFHYKPNVLLNDLYENCEGIIVLSGCISALIPKTLMVDEQLAEQYFIKFKEVFKDDFYTEIQLNNVQNNQSIMQKIYGLALKHNVKCVITTDSHYPYPEDKKYHDALKAISMKKQYNEAGYEDDCFYLMQEQELQAKAEKHVRWTLPYLEEFKKNTIEVFDKCDFKIEAVDEKDTLPKINYKNMTRAEMLKKKCIEGLEKNTPYKYEGKIKEKLDLELDRFIGKNYENYFLITADMVEWAKKNGIWVGPGRGSVGASLAAYALNITECDPIKYDLLFDRFISEIRRDAPDIDLDFMDNRRHEIYEFLKNKYGDKNCAKIATYARFHPKGALRDIGRIFKIPIKDIEEMCGLVIERSGGDARASFALSDTFAEFAQAKEFKKKYPVAVEIAEKLEGHIRHKGVHAAAMVVYEHNLGEYIPINRIGGEIVTEWEKQLVEDMNLIKFDILGLKTLSIIADCVESAGCKLPKTFDDLKVYKEIFQKGKTLGVFQFSTVGMTKYTQNLQVENFNELHDATTLFRPGALHSGQSMVYLNKKLGKNTSNDIHPLLEPITKDTRGIILYQEQVMQVMNQIGGMSWAAAETVRKVITKSKGKDAFNKMREEFVRNTGRLHGMSVHESEKLYDIVSTFGSYSFNKAHAVEYSQISYWCAWLKTYYPQHFYKSILKFENDNNVLLEVSQEAKNKGINIEYPHINYSQHSYTIHNNNIIAGFDSIVGVGEKTSMKIMKNQPYASMKDFIKRCKVSKKILKGLIVSDCFRDFNINKQAWFLDNHEIDEDFTDIEWAQHIYDLTTLNPKIDLLDSFNFPDLPYRQIKDLDDNLGNKQVFLKGIVTQTINKDKLLRHDLKSHVHKFEQHMIYLNLNDGTGNIAIQVGPATYEHYKHKIFSIEKQAIIVLGTLDRNGKKMYGDMIQIISMPDNEDIKKAFDKRKTLSGNHSIVSSAQPAVSKKGSSYYRVKLFNKIEGLCFRFDQKIFPGQEVKYRYTKPPFLDLEIIKHEVKE